MKKTILTAAVILALGLLLGGQTQEQMKQQTMTLPYPMKVPADVPPIEKRVKNEWISVPIPPAYSTHTELECADKTRFLLQSEDGKFHCLKLP